MRVFYLIIVLVFAVGNGVAETNTDGWKVISKKDGITLSQRVNPLSEYRTYKAETLIDIPLETLIEVLLDVKSYPEWMPGCTSSEIVSVKQVDAVIKDYVIHFIWDAMWPVTNRDFVMQTAASVDWNSGRASVTLDSIDDSSVPVPEKRFRLRKFYGKYEAWYISRDTTRVCYYNMVDPGGKVGPKLSNTFTKKIPIGMMKGLRRIAKEEKYSKAAAKDFY